MFNSRHLTLVLACSAVMLALAWWLSSRMYDSMGAAVDASRNAAAMANSANSQTIAEDAANNTRDSRGSSTLARGSADRAPTVQEQYAAYVDVLKEIAARISEGQLTEGEDELLALVQTLDASSEANKREFLRYFIDYSNNNAFNPEIVTAFDAVWAQLTVTNELRMESATTLASHFANSYEFTYALEQFDILTGFGVALDATQLRDLGYAQFSLQQYHDAAGSLLDHMDRQTALGAGVDRREYSMLFESYYREGALEEAEAIGNAMLDYFDDIQDWKDMQTFYVATGNEDGLNGLESRAMELDLMSADGDWVR